MKCLCGFDAPIWNWSMQEKIGLKRFSKSYRKEIAKRSDVPIHVKLIALFLPVPYHSTLYLCPRCATPAGSLENSQ